MPVVKRSIVFSRKLDKVTGTLFTFTRDFAEAKDAWAHAYMMRKRGYDDSGVQDTLRLFLWANPGKMSMTWDDRTVLAGSRSKSHEYDDHNEKMRRAEYVQQTYLTPQFWYEE